MAAITGARRNEGASTRSEIDAEHERLKSEFEEEAGPAVGAMPQTPPDNTAPPPEELRVDGTAQLAAFDLGGKRPGAASLRLSGGKILLVDGKAFKKGDVVHFEGTAVVREVGQRDKTDPQTQIVVSAEQKHVAQILDLTVRGAA